MADKEEAGGNGGDPKGKPRRNRDNEPITPPDAVELSRWWMQYCGLGPPRPWTKRAKIVQAQRRRVRKAVYEGWPELGIPAFRDREPAPQPLGAEVAGRATSQA